MFIVITNRSQLDLYLHSLASTGFNFTSSKISFFLPRTTRVSLAVLLKTLTSIDASSFLSLFLRFQFSLPYKRMGFTCVYILIFENFWTKVSSKVLCRIPILEQILLVTVECPFHIHRKFENQYI